MSSTSGVNLGGTSQSSKPGARTDTAEQTTRTHLPEQRSLSAKETSEGPPGSIAETAKLLNRFDQ